MCVSADRDGRLTGSDAVTFFQRSGLSRELLAKVWAQADYTRRGYLDLPAFAKAMDLISLAQTGLPLSQDSYRQAKASGIRPPRMAGLEATMGSARGTGTSNPFMPQQVGEEGLQDYFEIGLGSDEHLDAWMSSTVRDDLLSPRARWSSLRGRQGGRPRWRAPRCRRCRSAASRCRLRRSPGPAPRASAASTAAGGPPGGRRRCSPPRKPWASPTASSKSISARCGRFGGSVVTCHLRERDISST